MAIVGVDESVVDQLVGARSRSIVYEHLLSATEWPVRVTHGPFRFSVEIGGELNQQ